MRATIKDFTKEQRESVKVYKSHKISGGFYKVEYAIRNFENMTITTPQVSIIENVGGVKASLLQHLL